MPEQSHFIGGGAADTLLHPLVLVAMLLALFLVLLLPRKHVVVPALLFVFLAPLGQQVYVVGVHWLVGRIIFLAALARLSAYAADREWLAGRFNSVDVAFFICVLWEFVAFNLRYLSSQALLNQIGFLIDYLAAYVVLRVVIRTESDIYRVVKVLAVLTIVIGACMVREQLVRENLFGYLGGVPIVTEMRENKIRSQGVFQHPLTAGTFAGTLVPLFVLLWARGRAKLIAVGGLIGCTAMVVCSNSSTPLLAYAAGIFAMSVWRFRNKLRRIRLGVVLSIILLQFVMKAPVWFLIARVDLTGSSSGYHRAELVDQFIRRFGDWWLVGKNDVENWGWDMWDQQNQYVQVGQTGGLLSFVFLVCMISRACARLGDARKLVAGTKDELTLWLIGASLFSTLVGFFGVTYFDQSKVAWLTLLAIISAITASVLKTNAFALNSSESVTTDTMENQFAAMHSLAPAVGIDSINGSEIF